MEDTEARTERPTLVGSLLATTAAFLIAGVVGPIFVVIGLFDRGSWPLPTGVAITSVMLLAGLWWGLIDHRSSMRSYRLDQRSQPATAEVLDARGGLPFSSVISTPLVRARVRVRGEGFESFESVRRMALSYLDISRLFTGATTIPVRVDPGSGEWEVDWSRVREPTAAELLDELESRYRREEVPTDVYHRERVVLRARIDVQEDPGSGPVSLVSTAFTRSCPPSP